MCANEEREITEPSECIRKARGWISRARDGIETDEPLVAKLDETLGKVERTLSELSVIAEVLEDA